MNVAISAGLMDAIRTFPLEREVEHCGKKTTVSPFDIYSTCPQCQVRVKVRSFAAVSEIEDVFDAVFEWLGQPGAQQLMRRRQEVLEADKEE